MIRFRSPSDPCSLTALRAIRETEAYLAECLRNPQLAVRIPVVRVGYGRFPSGLAEEFWRNTLGIED